MRHWRLACWISAALASAGSPGRADDAIGPFDADARWMGAVHIVLSIQDRNACSAYAFAAQPRVTPSHDIQGVVTVDSGSMRYVFDPSQDDRRAVTSEVVADPLATLFARIAPFSAMAVAMGSGRTATVSLDGASLKAVRHCIDADDVSAGVTQGGAAPPRINNCATELC